VAAHVLAAASTTADGYAEMKLKESKRFRNKRRPAQSIV
jgi:hypothetical protein